MDLSQNKLLNPHPMLSPTIKVTSRLKVDKRLNSCATNKSQKTINDNTSHFYFDVEESSNEKSLSSDFRLEPYVQNTQPIKMKI